MDAETEAGFRQFVLARSPALLGTAFLLTGDRGAAEDLLQIALLKLYRQWPRLRDTENPEAYMRRVMANQRISWWRRRRVPEDAVDPPPDRPSSDATAGIDQRIELWQALHRLPPRTRAILVLRYWEDLSEVETARVLGCSVGSVKSQASRGLRRLREVLGEPGDGAAISKGDGDDVAGR
jgi:RNA polymerase sigma-70 factor (sigma-E family)